MLHLERSLDIVECADSLKIGDERPGVRVSGEFEFAYFAEDVEEDCGPCGDDGWAQRVAL